MARRQLIAAAAALVVLLVACGGAGGITRPRHVVRLTETEFTPKRITIGDDDAVTWEWKEDVLHNVTFYDFGSRDMSRGSYRRRFPERGIFYYRCTVHPGMEGLVRVE